MIEPPPAERPALIRRVIGFIGWLFTGLGFFRIFHRSKKTQRLDEIVVYSVHRSFFLWAIILSGFAFSAIVARWPGPRLELVLGWAYVWIVLYTLVSLLFDVSTPRLLLWAGVFLLIWLVSKQIEHVKHVAVLNYVFAYFRGLHPALNPGFATVMSWLLLPAWVGSLFHTFTNGRIRFSPNEIGEFQFGAGSELTDRSGLKFRTRYRDVFEMILGLGAGDLEAMDNHHAVLKRWENLLFLCFIWKRMDAVLHERSAIVDTKNGERDRPQAATNAGNP
jgi:hypothetical protein